MPEINGDDGDNALDGSSGADLINGFGGHDIIHGGAGDDLIIGGAGNDELWAMLAPMYSYFRSFAVAAPCVPTALMPTQSTISILPKGIALIYPRLT